MMNGQFVTIRDLMEKEDELLAAIRAEEEYRQAPSQWSAFEALSSEGRKSLVVQESHFDEQAKRRRDVDNARAALHAARSQWASYGAPAAPFTRTEI